MGREVEKGWRKSGGRVEEEWRKGGREERMEKYVAMVGEVKSGWRKGTMRVGLGEGGG